MEILSRLCKRYISKFERWRDFWLVKGFCPKFFQQQLQTSEAPMCSYIQGIWDGNRKLGEKQNKQK